MNYKSSTAIVKALAAMVPGLITTFWNIHKDIENSKTLEDLVDNVDWDAEYEALLREQDKSKRPWWKRIRK